MEPYKTAPQGGMFSPRLKSGIYLERLEDPVECLPVITCEQQKSMGDGGFAGFQVTGIIEWEKKNKNPQKSQGLPTKTPKTPMPNLWALKPFRKNCMYFIHRTTQPGYAGSMPGRLAPIFRLF